ncbi:SH3 domain-containing protein [Streptomyces sp. NPDC088354]|uniref:SH3 domain-containing protein n=1 Tax=Streptomyces sp. NPDC088354 TaxID=3365856 RepID=UPI0037FB6537
MAENSLDDPAEALVEAVAGGAAAADIVYYPVAPGCRLNVRTGPGTSFQIVRILPYDVKVPVICQVPGTTVNGYYGTSSIWDRIAPGEYVSDAYVHTGSDGYIAGRCG